MKEDRGSWIRNLIESTARRMETMEGGWTPRSDRLYWELKKEMLEDQLEVCEAGKPSVESYGSLRRFNRAMGFEPYQFPSIVDETSGNDYAKYKSVLERMGFPEKCCERAIAQLAVCELGQLPKPNIVINASKGCDPDKFQRRCLANLFNIPTFFIDIPLNEDDKPSLADLNYVADQLEECIQWVEEKVPGVKYNKDRHIEMQEIDAVAEEYQREILQLIKHVPCPIGPLDSYRKDIVCLAPSRYSNFQKGLEWFRTCRDELGEVVASGKGPYPEERLRLLWAGQVPNKRVLNIGKLLLKRRVAVPFNVNGDLAFLWRSTGPVGEVSEYGVVLSPLQTEARELCNDGWGGPGKRWIKNTLDSAREIGVQGIIHYNTIGCTSMRGMGSAVAERAEKELGIPTLNIEGRILDPDYMTQEQFDETLSAFIDKCFDWAGKPRQ